MYYLRVAIEPSLSQVSRVTWATYGKGNIICPDSLHTTDR